MSDKKNPVDDIWLYALMCFALTAFMAASSEDTHWSFPFFCTGVLLVAYFLYKGNR